MDKAEKLKKQRSLQMIDNPNLQRNDPLEDESEGAT